jgi:hypothetical protein
VRTMYGYGSRFLPETNDGLDKRERRA